MIVKFHQISAESALETISFDEGTLYFAEDTHRIFLDPVGGSSRIELTNIEIRENSTELNNIIAPIPGKLYCIINAASPTGITGCSLYMYKDGKWYDTSGHTHFANSIFGGTFGGTVYAFTSSTIAEDPSKYLLRNTKITSTETAPTINGEINWVYE